mmetsp:Transcript_16187/g.51651  ORF Transcript_16187/g.51651 Transcript_16187/m.51651 type:complete len:255 (+) Transcript_16187:344-1108(+)
MRAVGVDPEAWAQENTTFAYRDRARDTSLAQRARASYTSLAQDTTRAHRGRRVRRQRGGRPVRRCWRRAGVRSVRADAHRPNPGPFPGCASVGGARRSRTCLRSHAQRAARGGRAGRLPLRVWVVLRPRCEEGIPTQPSRHSGRAPGGAADRARLRRRSYRVCVCAHRSTFGGLGQPNRASVLLREALGWLQSKIGAYGSARQRRRRRHRVSVCASAPCLCRCMPAPGPDARPKKNHVIFRPPVTGPAQPEAKA